MQGIVLDPVLTGLHNEAPHARLKRACSEFESIFINYILKSMRKTVVKDGLLGNSHESKIFKAMFDENLAIGISRNGGIGLAKMLFERLNDRDSDLPDTAMEGGGKDVTGGFWGHRHV